MNPDRNGTIWTDERIVALRRLWSEGHTTAEIGRRIGVSKNAVIGKAHRLDLPSRPPPVRRADSCMSSTPHRVERPPVPKLAALMRLGSCPPETVQVRPGPIMPRLSEIRRITSCRWPIGDPRAQDFRFCGNPALVGKPYCVAHCGTAYRPAPPEAFTDLM